MQIDELTDIEKDMLGFALFDFSVKGGPKLFKPIIDLAIKLGVEEQVCKYAKSWIDYKPKQE